MELRGDFGDNCSRLGYVQIDIINVAVEAERGEISLETLVEGTEFQPVEHFPVFLGHFLREPEFAIVQEGLMIDGEQGRLTDIL